MQILMSNDITFAIGAVPTKNSQRLNYSLEQEGGGVMVQVQVTL